MTEENLWTKADASGAGCSNSGDDNSSCYIYFYPPAVELPNSEIYEFSQRSLMHVLNTSYLTVRGLEFAYTQSTAFAIEGGRGQVIENNILSHNSNSNDNAYAIFVSYGGGAIVRRNYIHDVGFGIETSGGHCHWTNNSCVPGDPEYFPGGDWQIYENVFAENGIGVLIHQFSEADTPSDNNRIFNNVFYKNTTAGVEMPVRLSGNIIANNIFIENARGIFMNHNGGQTKVIADFLPQFSGDNNLFFDNELEGATSDYFLRPDWTGNSSASIPYTVVDMQNDHSREPDGLGMDPQFVDAANLDFHLQSSSPAREAGDGTFYATIWVDMGLYPNIPATEDIFLPVLMR